LLRVVGYETVTFASAEAFLQDGLQMSPDCLVLDVWLPGISGVALLKHLVSLGSSLPVILITGREDIQIHLLAGQMGVSDIRLRAEGATTIVDVTGTVQTGGPIARLGQRLIGGVSKMMLDRFFACLQSKLAAHGT
jgi:CheY-like chemotaxis protein